jgi:hypothetical protein
MQHTTGRGRRARMAIAVAGALIAMFPTGASAAGEYSQHFCVTGYGDGTQNAWYGIGSPIPQMSCNSAASYPGNGLYGNTQTQGEDGYQAVRADAPPGASYRRLNTNLRIPYQACNRRTFVEDSTGYTFNNHNCYGGSASFNTAGVTYDIALHDSSFFTIGQSCNGSPGSCAASDWFLARAVAILYDSLAPTITTSNSGLFATNRTSFRGTVGVTADIVDRGKGPQAAEIWLDGNKQTGTDWPDATCNFRLSNPCANRLGWTASLNTALFPDGPHSVRVQAHDGLANVAYVDRTVIFDNTAPRMGSKPAIDGQTVSADSARLEFSALDDTTGVDRLERSIDNGAWEPAADGPTAGFSVSGTGQHTVRVRAVDKAGNTTAEQVVGFTLQATPSNQRLTTTTDQPLPGAPGPGDTVKCDVGGPWSEGTTFEFAWLRDSDVIDGSTGQTYTLGIADLGRRLGCRVTAVNIAGNSVRESTTVQTGSTANFGKGSTGSSSDATPSNARPGTDGTNGSNGSDSGDSSLRAGPASNGLNASDRAAVTLTGQRIRTVKFGRRIATVGRLYDENGRPIQKATLTVTERMYIPKAGLAPAAVWVPVGTLTTDDRGVFRYLIPARHSRTLRFGYKARLSDHDFTSNSELTLLVYSKAKLKVSRKVLRNGQAVRFKGRLLSRPIPRTGVMLDLQAYKPGRGWVTFKVTRAKTRTGRFKATYRFTSTSGTQNYRFRVRVRQDSNYPYLLSNSKQVRVKVSG